MQQGLPGLDRAMDNKETAQKDAPSASGYSLRLDGGTHVSTAAWTSLFLSLRLCLAELAREGGPQFLSFLILEQSGAVGKLNGE